MSSAQSKQFVDQLNRLNFDQMTSVIAYLMLRIIRREVSE